MPNLTFVLPHWLYWSGLIVFPIMAMVIVRRRAAQPDRKRPAVTLPIAYLLWVGGGFVGLHRFYVKSWWGFIFIPLFVLILFGNVEHRVVREEVSIARTNVSSLENLENRYERRLAQGRSGAQRQLDQIRSEMAPAREALAAAQEKFDFWSNFSGWVAAAIAVLLLFDAAILPKLVRRTNDIEGEAPPPVEVPSENIDQHDPALKIHTGFTNVIDGVNGWVGEFVAFWSIVAVFAYYYEVVARYVFNSPTNWAHEAMFLMFGMQYLIAGAYALREDAHVRVDVIYLMLSDRAKVITDIVTSFFFFVFAVTLLVTGWIFFVDAFEVREVSFTEWAIQYWPVKATMAIGAALLVLQGISKLIKDVILLKQRLA